MNQCNIQKSQSLASLQSLALAKIKEKSGYNGLNQIQTAFFLGDSNFIRALFRCSPSALDAATSLGISIINFTLQNFTRTYQNYTVNFPGLFNLDQKTIDVINSLTRNFQSSSLLHEVARRGNVGQIRRLVEENKLCDTTTLQLLNERDEKGRTPLMWACLNNSIQVVNFLLSKAVDLYTRDVHGQTAFLHACQGNTREVLDVLVKAGARFHDIDNTEGQHGAHHAARSNTRDVLEWIFRTSQVNIDIKDWSSRTPIHHAAAAGNYDNVVFLIERGSQVNKKIRLVNGCFVDDLGPNLSGMTPLHFAAQKGHASCVEVLLQHGATVTATTDCARSALMLAAENNHTGVVRAFLQHETGKVQTESAFDQTTTAYLAKQENFEVVGSISVRDNEALNTTCFVTA